MVAVLSRLGLYFLITDYSCRQHKSIFAWNRFTKLLCQFHMGHVLHMVDLCNYQQVSKCSIQKASHKVPLALWPLSCITLIPASLNSAVDVRSLVIYYDFIYYHLFMIFFYEHSIRRSAEDTQLSSLGQTWQLVFPTIDSMEQAAEEWSSQKFNSEELPKQEKKGHWMSQINNKPKTSLFTVACCYDSMLPGETAVFIGGCLGNGSPQQWLFVFVLLCTFNMEVKRAHG